MARPLTFLAPFLGAKALNPLGFGDDSLAPTEAEATDVEGGEASEEHIPQ